MGAAFGDLGEEAVELRVQGIALCLEHRSPLVGQAGSLQGNAGLRAGRLDRIGAGIALGGAAVQEQSQHQDGGQR
jgi:hypothetical protein